MNFEDRIFLNFKIRAKDAFKYHKCEHLIPNDDKEYEEILGCDRFAYVKYLKTKFKDGMNESNYGIEGWHIDHIFPLSRSKPEELKFWLHHLNTQPLFKQQNYDKCDFIFDLNEIRQVQKNICEAKSIDYVDTIDVISVVKYSKKPLRELFSKKQISESDISKIRANHRNSEFVKKQKEQTKQNLKEGKPTKKQFKGQAALTKKQIQYCWTNNIPLIKRIDGSYWIDNGKNQISHNHKNALSKKLNVEIPMRIVNDMVDENNKLRQRIQYLEYIIKNNQNKL